MKFGFNQILVETPKVITAAKRALNFFSGGIVAFLPQVAGWLHTTTDALTTVMGLFILFVNSVGLLFGVSPDAQKQ